MIDVLVWCFVNGFCLVQGDDVLFGMVCNGVVDMCLCCSVVVVWQDEFGQLWQIGVVIGQLLVEL